MDGNIGLREWVPPSSWPRKAHPYRLATYNRLHWRLLLVFFFCCCCCDQYESHPTSSSERWLPIPPRLSYPSPPPPPPPHPLSLMASPCYVGCRRSFTDYAEGRRGLRPSKATSQAQQSDGHRMHIFKALPLFMGLCFKKYLFLGTLVAVYLVLIQSHRECEREIWTDWILMNVLDQLSWFDEDDSWFLALIDVLFYIEATLSYASEMETSKTLDRNKSSNRSLGGQSVGYPMTGTGVW